MSSSCSYLHSCLWIRNSWRTDQGQPATHSYPVWTERFGINTRKYIFIFNNNYNNNNYHNHHHHHHKSLPFYRQQSIAISSILFISYLEYINLTRSCIRSAPCLELVCTPAALSRAREQHGEDGPHEEGPYHEGVSTEKERNKNMTWQTCTEENI